ncbi:ribokinase [Capsulimonas corticalis]|uniref:Ribokinase n=1 Tax=Capsulimonas corticalis TaxID=2219043 RepID=A0A402D3U4_9BACT|nr:ribokinase [Capsulimonas corticalis]BDI31831.1 ribokinase [Capsulimonas corticalis]
MNTSNRADGRTRPHVVVVGSSNTDMTARVARLPGPGETVLSERFEMVAGGKGANQAVAAARLGAQVTFVARVGADALGAQAIAGFQAAGIDTAYVVQDSGAPTGIALIGVDAARGENSIIVAPGANAHLSPSDVEAASEVIRNADIVVCQLETPLETVKTALRIAWEAGVLTVLNPAPAQPLPADLLALVDILTPNETEAVLLVGDTDASPEAAAQQLHALGVSSVVVTLGAAGALVSNADGVVVVAGRRAPTVVDTTGAGDCFTGALSVALAEGKDLRRAAEFAGAAASLSVAKAGAQPSMPTRADVDAILKN